MQNKTKNKPIKPQQEKQQHTLTYTIIIDRYSGKKQESNGPQRENKTAVGNSIKSLLVELLQLLQTTIFFVNLGHLHTNVIYWPTPYVQQPPLNKW